MIEAALDVMTTPASSCDSEPMFSKLGGLLEPKSRKVGSELLATLQSLRRWLTASFQAPSSTQSSVYTDAEMNFERYVKD